MHHCSLLFLTTSSGTSTPAPLPRGLTEAQTRAPSLTEMCPQQMRASCVAGCSWLAACPSCIELDLSIMSYLSDGPWACWWDLSFPGALPWLPSSSAWRRCPFWREHHLCLSYSHPCLPSKTFPLTKASSPYLPGVLFYKKGKDRNRRGRSGGATVFEPSKCKNHKIRKKQLGTAASAAIWVLLQASPLHLHCDKTHASPFSQCRLRKDLWQNSPRFILFH